MGVGPTPDPVGGPIPMPSASESTTRTTKATGPFAPHAHSGWRDMRYSVSVRLPFALHNAGVSHRAALRNLRRAARRRG